MSQSVGQPIGWLASHTPSHSHIQPATYSASRTVSATHADNCTPATPHTTHFSEQLLIGVDHVLQLSVQLANFVLELPILIGFLLELPLCNHMLISLLIQLPLQFFNFSFEFLDFVLKRGTNSNTISNLLSMVGGDMSLQVQ